MTVRPGAVTAAARLIPPETAVPLVQQEVLGIVERDKPRAQDRQKRDDRNQGDRGGSQPCRHANPRSGRRLTRTTLRLATLSLCLGHGSKMLHRRAKRQTHRVDG